MRLGEQHRPLRFLVVDELRERILSGEISPGVRLVEDHIAAELGVSRSPVREALRALETEGLVELSPRRGVFVAAVSQEDAVQIFEAREALESFAARLAARNATSDELLALQELLASTALALAEGNPEQITILNTEFHALICRIAGNQYIAELLTAISGRMEWIRRQNAMSRVPDWLHEHEAIVEAISAGDEELAAERAVSHIRAARDAYIRSQQQGDGGDQMHAGSHSA